MAQIIHEVVQQIVIDIDEECHTERDLRGMYNVEILELVDRIRHGRSNEGVYDIHVKETIKVIDVDDETIRLIKKL